MMERRAPLVALLLLLQVGPFGPVVVIILELTTVGVMMKEIQDITGGTTWVNV